jgi:hypothetical protein
MQSSDSFWCVVFDLGGVIGGNLHEFFFCLEKTNPNVQKLGSLFNRNKDLWEKVKLQPAFTLRDYWTEIKQRGVILFC